MGEFYYTIVTASKVLPLTVRTIRQYCVDGRLQAVKSDSKYKWEIPESEIERLKKDLDKKKRK